ncbi:MAG: hypothetical protein ACFFDF_12220 [Candidatus Odinarchaeota archaeon]
MDYINNLINGEGTHSQNLLTEVTELMYNIHKMDSISSINDKVTLYKLKSEVIKYCKAFIKTNYKFTSETSILFEKLFQEAFMKGGKLTKAKSFDEIGILCDLIGFYENYHGYDRIVKNYFLARNQKDSTKFLNEFTKSVWGKSYNELLAEVARDNRFMDTLLIEELQNIVLHDGGRVDLKLEELIGVVRGPNIEGNNLFYLNPGYHDFDTESGSGLVHIVARHLTRSQFKKWGINSPKELASFLLETIANNMDRRFKPDLKKGGGEILYKVVDKKGNNQVLKMIVSSDRFIVSAMTIKSYKKGLDLFNSQQYMVI